MAEMTKMLKQSIAKMATKSAGDKIKYQWRQIALIPLKLTASTIAYVVSLGIVKNKMSINVSSELLDPSNGISKIYRVSQKTRPTLFLLISQTPRQLL